MKIKIIVPTFERLEFTKRFVKSINEVKEYDIEIVIIDDSYTKETSSFFLNQDVTILSGSGELWWGGGINLGIDYLSSLNLNDNDIVIFANNDVFIQPDSFIRLVNTVFDSSDRLILHPKTFNENGEFVSSGSRVISWFPFITTHKINTESRFSEIDLGTARFLVMKYEDIKINGQISIGLPQYQGDNDFTFRAKKNGSLVYIDGLSTCYLDDSVTGLKNTNIKNLKELYYSFLV